MEVYNHDLVILGTGLAGLRAALEAAQQSKGELDIALVSKLQLMRAHSVAAEGGTAAVMRQDMGDSFELHAWDTVKGSDFLADQDVVDFFVHEMPKEILHLDHWGIPGRGQKTDISLNVHLAGTRIPAPFSPLTKRASSRCKRCTTP